MLVTRMMKEMILMNNKINLTIWGRTFDLYYIYQNYSGEEVLPNQERTVEQIPNADFQSAMEAVKRYILKHNKEELQEESIPNLFKYVMPKRILIPRETEKRVFAIMCNYKFDMEHGLAIVFENEKFVAVGLQDIIL